MPDDQELQERIDAGLDPAAISISCRYGADDAQIKTLAEEQVYALFRGSWLLNIAVETIQSFCGQSIPYPESINPQVRLPATRIKRLVLFLASGDPRIDTEAIVKSVYEKVFAILNAGYLYQVTHNAWRDHLKTPAGRAQARIHTGIFRDFPSAEAHAEAEGRRRRSASEIREFLKLVWGPERAGSDAELLIYAYSPPRKLSRRRKSGKPSNKPPRPRLRLEKILDFPRPMWLWKPSAAVQNLGGIRMADLAEVVIAEYRRQRFGENEIDNVFASLRSLSRPDDLLRNEWDPCATIQSWIQPDKSGSVAAKIARTLSDVGYAPWRIVADFGGRPLFWIVDQLRKRHPYRDDLDIRLRPKEKKEFLGSWFSPSRVVCRMGANVEDNIRKLAAQRLRTAIEIVAAPYKRDAFKAVAFLCSSCIGLSSARIQGLYSDPGVRLGVIIDELINTFAAQWKSNRETVQPWFKTLINGNHARPQRIKKSDVEAWVEEVRTAVSPELRARAPLFAARYGLDMERNERGRSAATFHL